MSLFARWRRRVWVPDEDGWFTQDGRDWTPPDPLQVEPKSSLQEAIDRARYPDPVEFINAYNEARRGDNKPTNQIIEPNTETVSRPGDSLSEIRTKPPDQPSRGRSGD